jgi:hypothetical protein
MSCGVITQKLYSPRTGSWGALRAPEIHLRRWDVEFKGVAIELDEHLHFNRYRAQTLESKIYRFLPSFLLDRYRRYCLLHEEACLKAGGYGGKWSNKSCERQFGGAGEPRDLNGSGSPRWKQRAFYDFVKDLSPLLIGVKVARIAIWDEVSDGSRMGMVESILKAPSPQVMRSLMQLLQERIG